MFIQFVKVGGLAIDAHNIALLGVETVTYYVLYLFIINILFT